MGAPFIPNKGPSMITFRSCCSRIGIFLVLVALCSGGSLVPITELAGKDTWRGLVIAPEARCSPYNSGDYYYPQSVEAEIVAELGAIFSPYTGEVFASTRQTDIEHIVARSEAHDSGLCAADLATRRQFASDLLNLTLSAPYLNRWQKRDHDAADWLPTMNRCWFTNRIVEVRRKYRLTVDRREADVLERVLSTCSSTELVRRAKVGDRPSFETPPASQPNSLSGNVDALSLWDDNRNGRITCAEARRHGIAPVPRGHPAYPFMRDGDGDGVVCE